MPTHHEYVFDQFVVSPKRRKIFAQLCIHKSYGTTFQDLLTAEASVLVPKYTIRYPKENIQNQVHRFANNFQIEFYISYSLIHAKILVPYNRKVINRFEFAATKLYALYN